VEVKEIWMFNSEDLPAILIALLLAVLAIIGWIGYEVYRAWGF